MGIERSKLLDITKQVMEKPLNELGYQFQEELFDIENWCFGFIKKSDELNLYLYLDFQPWGFNPDFLFGLYINLVRTRSDNLNYPDFVQTSLVEKYYIRMDPMYFEKEYKGEGWSWQFATDEEAKQELLDALEKIVAYGIPYLEDPTSTRKWLRDWY